MRRRQHQERRTELLLEHRTKKIENGRLLHGQKIFKITPRSVSFTLVINELCSAPSFYNAKMKRIRQGMRVDPATLRVRLVELARASVDACSARAPEGDESPPLVLCARHKALAVDAELGALAANEEAVLTQLEATRDVEIAAGRPADEVAAGFAARVSEVYAAAAAKRVALETAAVTADAALENALAVVAALTEVGARLNVDSVGVRLVHSPFARHAGSHVA